MRLKNLLLGSVIALLFTAVFIQASRSVSAATKTINIMNNLFSPESHSITVGDQILFENEDFVPHVLEIRRATDSGLVHTENFVAKVGETKDTYQRTFNVAGEFSLILDTNGATGLVTVLQSSPSPSSSVTASPTSIPTTSPSISPTASPTATATASPTPSPTVSPTVSATPTPTVSPTFSPSPSPTVSATSSATATPTATPTVEPTSSSTPTVSPSASPTVAPTATASPTPSPTSSPTATATPSPTVAPTATPTPTIPSAPLPAVLPGFSVFRPTTCAAQINTGKTEVITDKVTSVYMTRGYWNVTSITQIDNGISVSAVLYQVQKINLLFGGNPFFGGNKVTAANESAVFVGSGVPDVLQKAKNAWCLR